MAKQVKLRVTNPTSGDPVKGTETVEEKMFISPNRTPIHDNLDIRDMFYELVGKGNALKPDDKAAIYGKLQTLLGQEKAQKVMNHAFIFNSRPDVQKVPVEDRLTSFFTIGSNDADVNQLIQKTKSLGYGVLPGFRTSSSSLNQELSGKTPVVASAEINPEIQKKVMVKVRK